MSRKNGDCRRLNPTRLWQRRVEAVYPGHLLGSCGSLLWVKVESGLKEIFVLLTPRRSGGLACAPCVIVVCALADQLIGKLGLLCFHPCYVLLL